jgi:hypothetical protein
VRLGEFLIRRRAITPRQLWQALLVQERAAPGEIEVVDSVLGDDDEAARARILAYAAAHRCTILLAATRLGVRQDQELREATTRLHRRRCPRLGEILVKLSYVTKEAMTAHLDEFFRMFSEDRTPVGS